MEYKGWLGSFNKCSKTQHSRNGIPLDGSLCTRAKVTFQSLVAALGMSDRVIRVVQVKAPRFYDDSLRAGTGSRMNRSCLLCTVICAGQDSSEQSLMADCEQLQGDQSVARCFMAVGRSTHDLTVTSCASPQNSEGVNHLGENLIDKKPTSHLRIPRLRITALQHMRLSRVMRTLGRPQEVVCLIRIFNLTH